MKKLAIFSTIFLWAVITNAATIDPLPLWNEGKVKQHLIQFVHDVTDKASPYYVPPADRIATFDNDGTLWVEQPLYTQSIFAIDRVKALAPNHPEWKQQEPFASILKNHTDALSLHDFEQVLAVTHSGMSVENYEAIAKQWLATTKDSHFKHLYTQLVYLPMLEVMNYLRQNGFDIYIVSGGGQDFIRAFSQPAYHVSVAKVIGSAGKTNYAYQAGKSQLIKLPKVLFIDDKAGKPEAIYLFIGKKPIIAFGNSVGDQQMLEWTQSGQGKRLMLLVHHDDAKREYAYDTQSKIGTFSTALMQEAQKNNWEVISMKKDWKRIFSFD